MTKRFTRVICSNDEYTGSLYCNDEPLMIEEVCNLLNELHEENTYLKLELDTHKHPLWSTREAERIVNELKEENGQLKNENQKLDEKICLLTMDLIKTKSYEQLEKELNRIKNDNEKLKNENAKMKKELSLLAEFNQKVIL